MATSCPAEQPASSAKLPRWEKVLYRKQPYDDNYVDKQQFLEHMRENANVEVFEYWTCVRETAGITQQLCIVVAFVVLFKHFWDGTLSLRFMIGLDATLFVLAIILWPILVPTLTMKDAANAARSACVFFVILLLLSPVMHTLTSAYSEDTIWALSILLLTIHVACNDYQYINGNTDTYTGVISINAATFSAVLLASRLPSSLHAFTILALAIILFGLFPVLRHNLKKYTVDGYVSLTWLLFGLVLASLALLLEVLSVIFFLTILTITFVVPKILISMQLSWKKQIHGPWDEAKPPPTESSLLWKNMT